MPRQQKAPLPVLRNHSLSYYLILHNHHSCDESSNLEDRTDKDRGNNYYNYLFLFLRSYFFHITILGGVEHTVFIKATPGAFFMFPTIIFFYPTMAFFHLSFFLRR